MNEHASVHCYGERADGKGALLERTSWHRLLLACAAMAFTVCSPLPGEAVNGEPVGGQGVHTTANCDTDFRVSCDDRSADGFPSCNMRGTQGDEGLAVNVCFDGRITSATAQTLEFDVTEITATDFGEYVCGKGPNDGPDFCIVCDTFHASGSGASNCVKIVDDGGETGPSTCGAYNISQETGAYCLGATQDLQQIFSDPHVGFTIAINGKDASLPAQKDIVVCGTRSWQCINNTTRSSIFPIAAGQVQQSTTHALINTPCCIRLASGSYYCSAKLTPSSTCK